ncbi:MAG TPA: thioredoxin family protein [Geobacteraceae bacterium]
MDFHKGRLVRNGASLAFMALAVGGCASVETAQVIKPGDNVGIHFTCRLPNGDIAVTSEKEITADAKGVKSAIFVPREVEDLVKVVAGGDPAYSSRQITDFEEDVMQGIAVGLPGTRSGERREVELASSATVNGELRLNRIRHASKEKRISIDEFKAESGGKEPEVGQKIYISRELPGVVKEIKDNTVLITFTATDGTVVTTPLGPGKVRDAGKRYDIIIEAKQGAVMRMGPWVGRVKYADDRNFDLDFSKTFGGEKLRCEVTAEVLKPAPPAQPGKEESGKADAATDKPQKTASSSPDDVQRRMNLLQKTITEAIKSGKTSVSIDTDALDASLAPVAKGDLVTLRFTARELGGAPLSLPEAMAGQGGAQEIMAGNEELFPGLGDAVIGMAAGEKKQVTLPPERAFGPKNPAKTASFPLQNTVPARIRMAAEEYVKRFGGFPAAGKEVPLFPFLMAKVTEIGDKDVTLEVEAKDGESFSEPFGTITLSVGKENVTISLAPKVGGPFNTGDQQGVVTGSDKENFTVDFNPPLAGKTIVVDLEVLSVARSADLKTLPIDWIESRDAGLAEAKKEGKPLFLLLYADWCHWCQKTQNETLTDPRIGRLRDRFVWMRLNSDKENKYKQMYGQNGFPLMVILRPDGTVLKKIDGYRDASRLAAELKAVL